MKRIWCGVFLLGLLGLLAGVGLLEAGAISLPEAAAVAGLGAVAALTGGRKGGLYEDRD